VSMVVTEVIGANDIRLGLTDLDLDLDLSGEERMANPRLRAPLTSVVDSALSGDRRVMVSNGSGGEIKQVFTDADAAIAFDLLASRMRRLMREICRVTCSGRVYGRRCVSANGCGSSRWTPWFDCSFTRTGNRSCHPMA
jgi:hypothetical protein